MQQEHDVLQIHQDKTWHRVIRERWQKIKGDLLTSYLKSKDFLCAVVGAVFDSDSKSDQWVRSEAKLPSLPLEIL